MPKPRRKAAKPQPQQPSVRFEATVHPGGEGRALAEVDRLGLDRVPDPEGGVRVLAAVDDLVRLVERGFEVHILRAMPVRPLARKLIADKDDVQAWLEAQVEGIARRKGSSRRKGS